MIKWQDFGFDFGFSCGITPDGPHGASVPFFLSCSFLLQRDSSEYLAVVLGEESIRAWGAGTWCSADSLAPSLRIIIPGCAWNGTAWNALHGPGQAAASPRSVSHSQTWAAGSAPCNHLQWVLKPSQLMSQGDFSYPPAPPHWHPNFQLAKCQQKLLLMPMRWITLAVKIISDVLLRCLMGLLFKHGWCEISPRHYSQQVIESHLMSIFRTE